jgi:class 3 adenylate cyclase
VDKQLATLGLRFADPDEERRFRAEHAASVLPRQRVLIAFALVAFLAYAVRDLSVGPTFGYSALYLRIFFILPVLGLGFVLTYSESIQPHFQTVFMALIVIVIAAVGMLSLLYPQYAPTDPAQANRTITTVMLTLAIMGAAGLMFAHAFLVGAVAVLFWILGSIAKELAPELFPTMFLNVATAFVVGAFVAYWMERAARDAFAARRETAREREKAGEVLYAALPRHVVERVARDDRPIAEAFVEAVVVLADLAEFNTLSKRIGPRQTVELLDELFTAFDALAERHQLQRLRTVGDSYCVVGGTFEGLRGGAPEAAQMALDMIAAVEAVARRFDLPLAVRVGVHVGPLIGGVVGRTAPIYDFWGDTFNVVSDLQIAAEGGQILCSENFYWRAGRAWAFEPRGTRELPGIGTLQTFYLRGPAADGKTETSDGT